MLQAEFLAQQLQNAPISVIALVEKVDDHNVVFLAIAMASTYALFNALGVPRQIVVHDQRAELEVYAFRCGFGCQKNSSLITKMFHERCTNIERAGA